MIAVDTNILVYAHREDASHHDAALHALRGLAESRRPWALPWPCLHEFLAIVTHPRVYSPPSSMDHALQAFDDLICMRGVHVIGEDAGHAPLLRALLEAGGVTGPKVHDARIAAICLAHGVDRLWTADRDFSFFPTLRTENPLVRSGGPAPSQVVP